MYYNTTKQLGRNLIKARDEAFKQDERVLAVFEAFPNGTLSPWIIRAKMETNAPITSIRRAINTLTKSGKLLKTQTKMMGPYGKESFTWQLNAHS